jgi:hypothetical protein
MNSFFNLRTETDSSLRNVVFKKTGRWIMSKKSIIVTIISVYSIKQLILIVFKHPVALMYLSYTT